MSTRHKQLYLIDVSSFIFRAFFAIPHLSTSKGHPTNATYGFLNMVLNVLEKHNPDAVVAVFDSKEPSFRKERYKEYKANRGAPPDLLVPQFGDIDRAVKILGMPSLRRSGFEADDLIAGLVKAYPEHEITIVTGDKDLMQLVNDRVSLLDTMKELRYGPKEVEDKLGVPPKLVADYLGLIGDSSDNIPGVPSIGPKTAVELLKNHGSIEAVLAAAPTMKGKRAEVLQKHADDARLSKELATVHADVDVSEITDRPFKDLCPPQPYPDAFGKFLAEMELYSLLKKFGFDREGNRVGGDAGNGAPVSVQAAAVPQNAVAVSTKGQWRDFMKAAQNARQLSVGATFIGDGTISRRLGDVTFCVDGENVYHLPLRSGGDISSEEFVEEFLKLQREKRIISYDTKELVKVLLNEGAKIEQFNDTKWFDPMIAHYVAEPEEKHDMRSLVARYLDYDWAEDEERTVDLLTREASAMCALEPKLIEFGTKEELKLFETVEMPLAFVLAEMEYNGIAIDAPVLNELSKEFGAELKQIEARIYKIAGGEFNLNSPKQLSEVLFTKLGLPVIRKTKTGFSTDVDVLEKLSSVHEVPAHILRYRELSKLKSTYVDVLPGLMERDGRVHARFNQTVTATGRLSSSDPNLQNIPIKTTSGRRIRKAFVPSEGNVLVGADYSQVELRLVAHLSQDASLVEAFREGRDVHRATAAEIFKVSPNEVSDEQRGIAKAINFGLIYGKTAFGLSQELGISRTEAQQYIDTYFHRYSGVKRFMDKCLEDARATGVARTLFGRKRILRDIASKNMAVRNNAERMAMNTPVQGTAADIMKVAMLSTAKECRRLGAKLVLQVHDELVADVPLRKGPEMLDAMKKTMTGAASLSVPLEVNAGQASNWMDL